MQQHVRFDTDYETLSAARRHVVAQLDPLHNDPENPWN